MRFDDSLQTTKNVMMILQVERRVRKYFFSFFERHEARNRENSEPLGNNEIERQWKNRLTRAYHRHHTLIYVLLFSPHTVKINRTFPFALTVRLWEACTYFYSVQVSWTSTPAVLSVTSLDHLFGALRFCRDPDRSGTRDEACPCTDLLRKFWLFQAHECLGSSGIDTYDGSCRSLLTANLIYSCPSGEEDARTLHHPP